MANWKDEVRAILEAENFGGDEEKIKLDTVKMQQGKQLIRRNFYDGKQYVFEWNGKVWVNLGEWKG